MAEETPQEAAPATPPPKAPPPAFQSARHPWRKRFPSARPLGLWSVLLGVLSIMVVVLGIITLVTWLVYRPHKPRFYVERAWIYDLNVTDGSVKSNMQFTVLVQNPNRRWTVRYDRLVAFVTYRGQLITMVTPLPNMYQGRRSISPVYTYVAGNFVPVFPDVARSLVIDEAYGLVELSLELRGRFTWRTTIWKSTHCHLYVTCHLMVGMKDRINGRVPLFREHRCHVDV